MVVRNKNCKDGDKKWIRLKSSITLTGTINVMQHGSLSVLANVELVREAEARETSTITPPRWRQTTTTTTISQALLTEEVTLTTTAKPRALSVGMEVTLAATARPRKLSVGMEVELSVSSQQQTSIAVNATVNETSTDPLLAGQVFRYLIFTS
jgi:hypothetical protein